MGLPVMKPCELCGEPILSGDKRSRFCSRECVAVVLRGRKMPLEQRLRVAESNRRTKAAPPDDERRCPVCEGLFRCRPQSTQRLCSIACRAASPRPARTLESRQRLSEKYKGEGNPAWKGGVTKVPEYQRDRQTMEYKAWRAGVMHRDGWTCQDCGAGGGRKRPFVAHHIERWVDAPDLRFDLDNGVTLCVPCHRVRHGWTPEPLSGRL